VLAFTGGKTVPSARFRVRQYLSSLRALGIEIEERFPVCGAYPPKEQFLRPLWALGTVAERLPSVLASYRYDLTFLQREMVSTLVTWEPFTHQPRVLDVDDSIWIFRGGAASRRLSAVCNSVICGNAFLAEHFGQWNPRVTILPTAIDTERFRPPEILRGSERPIIGWSGGSAGLQELYRIEKSLWIVLQKHPQALLRIICDSQPRFKLLPPERVEFFPWSTENEIRGLQGINVGIMPLAETIWNRGKCSYKMLLCMSCGVPTVVSPVGMNREILKMGEFGLGAESLDDWVSALDLLLKDPEGALRWGTEARKIVIGNFGIACIVPRLAAELLRAAG
jgi:glycosyltransferase involved in cell wall biosynthesis